MAAGGLWGRRVFSTVLYALFHWALAPISSSSHTNPPVFPCGWAWTKRRWLTHCGWCTEHHHYAALFCIPPVKFKRMPDGTGCKMVSILTGQFSCKCYTTAQFPLLLLNLREHQWLACLILNFFYFSKNKITNSIRYEIKYKDHKNRWKKFHKTYSRKALEEFFHLY